MGDDNAVKGSKQSSCVSPSTSRRTRLRLSSPTLWLWRHVQFPAERADTIASVPPIVSTANKTAECGQQARRTWLGQRETNSADTILGGAQTMIFSSGSCMYMK